MAGGAELLAFERFRASSSQPLTYGYGPRRLRELRAREFGRLAGEAGGAPAGAGGAARGPRGFRAAFCSRRERRHLVWGAF